MLQTLNDRDERIYPKVVNGVYTRRITATLQDRLGNTIANLTPALQGGDITLDATADVTRMAHVTVLDPKHNLGFDADTYQGGALDLTRQLRIVWGINSPLLSDEVRIGVFKGPISNLRRDGALVEIEAQGKEVFGLGRAPRTVTYPEGTRRTDVIKAILRDLMGETRLGHIPDLKAKLGGDLVIKHADQPWKQAVKLANSMSRQLFYDGNGVPIMRVRPEKVGWTFRSGPGGGLTSPLRVNTDLTKVRNHVKVTGADPKGKGTPPVGAATAPANHPLSPVQLGPPGAPMYLTEEITNEHCRSEAECVEVATNRLNFMLRLIHDVQFNSAPVAHLDPEDLIRVVDTYEAVTTQLEQFTLPLTLDGDMSVGYSDPYRLKRVRRTGGSGGGKQNGKGKRNGHDQRLVPSGGGKAHNSGLVPAKGGKR